jgi:amino acid transporter
MVAVKLLVILVVIAVGFFYVNPGNWSPFMPNGIAGVLKGVAAVFWAFIGFDAITTTAEECENSQRDLPRAIFYALGLCTVFYVVIAFVLTGIVSYKELNVADPLAYIFRQRLPWLSGVIAFSAIFVIGSVFLVFQLGQPRIWMSMSRDGLLPPIFSRIHPRFQTPSFSTVVTGFLVAVPALFLNLKEVIDLSSIGTLFAFVLVCGGVLVLQSEKNPAARPKFRTPYINGRYLVPLMWLAVVIFFISGSPESARGSAWREFWNLKPQPHEHGQTGTGWEILKERLPMLAFILVSMTVAVLSFLKQLSLIPVLGLLTCLYLMTQLGYTNWLRFLVWLVAGLVIYFCYGRRASKLNGAISSPRNR